MDIPNLNWATAVFFSSSQFAVQLSNRKQRSPEVEKSGKGIANFQYILGGADDELGEIPGKFGRFADELEGFADELGGFADELEGFADELAGFADELGVFSAKLEGFANELGVFADRFEGFADVLGIYLSSEMLGSTLLELELLALKITGGTSGVLGGGGGGFGLGIFGTATGVTKISGVSLHIEHKGSNKHFSSLRSLKISAYCARLLVP